MDKPEAQPAEHAWCAGAYRAYVLEGAFQEGGTHLTLGSVACAKLDIVGTKKGWSWLSFFHPNYLCRIGLAMNDQIDCAVMRFIELISSRYEVGHFLLFGSRARDDFHTDSDLDIAVIIKGENGDFVDTKLSMADLAYDVLLETGVKIQPLPIWEGEWEHPENYPNPRLLLNIEREGIRL